MIEGKDMGHGKCLVCNFYLKSPNKTQVCTQCRYTACKKCGKSVKKQNADTKGLCSQCSVRIRRAITRDSAGYEYGYSVI